MVLVKFEAQIQKIELLMKENVYVFDIFVAIFLHKGMFLTRGKSLVKEAYEISVKTIGFHRDF